MGSAMRRDARAGAGRGKRRQAQNCGDRSGAGHEGAVEGLVGWSRRNFMVPLPRFASLEALNGYLTEPSRVFPETALIASRGQNRVFPLARVGRLGFGPSAEPETEGKLDVCTFARTSKRIRHQPECT